MTTVASKPLHIRRAVRADLADMLRIEQASFADPWTVDSLATALSLERMHVLVAESVGEGHMGGDAGNGLLGYVVALLIGPEAEIADLAVAPEARRLGVGRALLQRVLSELHEAGARTAHLEVRESNEAARTLYETSGFGSVGRRRRYYRNPVEDALLLMREIGPT